MHSNKRCAKTTLTVARSPFYTAPTPNLECLKKPAARGNPYRIYGGQRFFERLEIKNALAYLRLLRSRHDDGAIERVINVPTRGVGEKTIDAVRQAAREHDVSLWQAIHLLIENKALPGRASNALQGFVDLVNELDTRTLDCELHAMTQIVIEQSGLLKYHKEEKGEKGQARVENLEELVSAARTFSKTEDSSASAGEIDNDLSPLVAFLDHAVLEAGDNQADEFTEAGAIDDIAQRQRLRVPGGIYCWHGGGLIST